MRIQALCVAALAVGLAGCVSEQGDDDEAETDLVDTAESSIVGGATTSAYPAVGMLYWFAEKSLCSAFLVGKRTVMTAAHCVKGKRLPDGFYTGPGVRLAAPPTSPSQLSGVTRYVVDASVVHPSYGGGGSGTSISMLATRYKSDFALLRLKTAPAGSSIAFGTTSPTVGQRCVAVGYGYDSEGTTIGAMRKRYGTVSVAGLAPSGFIEAKRVNAEPAKGDSGSPLLCGGVAVGVLSWWYAANANVPANDRDFYVNVLPVRSWVATQKAAWGG